MQILIISSYRFAHKRELFKLVVLRQYVGVEKVNIYKIWRENYWWKDLLFMVLVVWLQILISGPLFT